MSRDQLPSARYARGRVRYTRWCPSWVAYTMWDLDDNEIYDDEICFGADGEGDESRSKCTGADGDGDGDDPRSDRFGR